MLKRGKTFESEVHLGLLVIILILLFLNVTSNFIIYSARSLQSAAVADRFNRAALTINRSLGKEIRPILSEADVSRLKQRFDLSSLALIPSRPTHDNKVAKGRWLQQAIRQIAPGEVTQVARKVLSSNFGELTRGEGAEYFYVHPLEAARGKPLLILATNSPGLAQLDDARGNIMIISVVCLVLIAAVYLLLSRFIFRPFRKIRKEADKAGHPVDDADGEAEGVVKHYLGIIEELRRKEAELIRLNQAVNSRADSLEQFNQYLLSSMSTGLISLDSYGKVRSINSAAATMLNVTAESCEGKLYTEVLSCCREMATEIESVITTGGDLPYREMTIAIGSGTKRILGMSVASISDATGSLVGTSISLNDLSEIRHLQTELEKKHILASLGEMAAGLAHQLRNSMGAIVGYTQLVQKRLTKNQMEIGPTVALLDEAHEAEQLIGRFLTFAKPLDLECEPTDLATLLADVVESFTVRDDCGHIQYSLSCPTGIEVNLDRLLIKQTITNLVENASNAYDSEPGTVSITGSVQGSEVVVAVTDKASGITESDMEHIFTPFFSTRPSGNGLGLPLAAKIVDMHGGSIDVDTQPGEGTSFILTLPQAATEQSVSSRV